MPRVINLRVGTLPASGQSHDVLVEEYVYVATTVPLLDVAWVPAGVGTPIPRTISFTSGS